MNDRTESHASRELDDDERFYATAPIDGIRRELSRYSVRTEPVLAAVRALIDERTPRARGASVLDPESTFLQQIDTIRRVSAFIARRNHLAIDETEEFVQIVFLKLIENDFAIVRKFEGRSSFVTYCTTVIVRLFSQWRIEQWGRWRPSAQARALGEDAIALERLTSRDGFSIPEAVTLLTTQRGCTVEELEVIRARLPRREPRPVFVSDDEAVADLAEESAEDRVVAGEREIARRAVFACLERTIDDLEPEDRLMVQLRFRHGMKVPEIARLMKLEQRKVYQRFACSYRLLQRALADAGIDRALIADLLDGQALDQDLPYRNSTRQSHRRPPS